MFTTFYTELGLYFTHLVYFNAAVGRKLAKRFCCARLFSTEFGINKYFRRISGQSHTFFESFCLARLTQEAK